jgi:predicted NAD/FAD-dependent oxidoreductase
VSAPGTVCVIGAGIAGLACARRLQEGGLSVTVFEKARGPSGRMSTRRSEGGLQFDHGAQYFTAQGPSFSAAVERWVQGGHTGLWSGRFGTLRDGRFEASDLAPRFVGTPRMSALGRHLAGGLSVRTQTRVVAAQRLRAGWRLVDAGGASLGPFDQLVVAVPAPQAVPLLQASPELQAVAAAAEMVPCQALMLRFEDPPRLPFEGARVVDDVVAWIAHDSSKPGRPTPGCWVVHGTPMDCARHLEEPLDQIATRLARRFRALTGVEASPAHAIAHRWRYARPAADRVPGSGCRLDPDLRVGVCGDWLVGARVEGAWLSGRALADRILDPEGP